MCAIRMAVILMNNSIILSGILLLQQATFVRASDGKKTREKFIKRLSEKTEISVPIVLMHGLGCYGKFLFLDERAILEHVKPQPYVKIIHTAPNIRGEMLYSVGTQLKKQVNDICRLIKEDAKLKHGYSIVGYSQGGVIMRGVVEICDGPPVFNLITLGSPHQGVYGFPFEKLFGVKKFKKHNHLDELAATKWMQKHTAVAGYWHNPFDEAKYKKLNEFLPDINNENKVKTEYKERFSKLNLLVLVVFNKDTMIIPYESTVFGFFKPGDEKGTINRMEETDLYKQDSIGLRTLDEQKKVVIIEVDRNHVIYNRKWFIENIATPFLTLKMESVPCPIRQTSPGGTTSSSNSPPTISGYFRLKSSQREFNCFRLRKSSFVKISTECLCWDTKKASSIPTSQKSICFPKKTQKKTTDSSARLIEEFE